MPITAGDLRKDASETGKGKKCGASYIPKAATCTKNGSLRTKLQKGAEIAANVGGAVTWVQGTRQLARGNWGAASQKFLTSAQLNATAASSRLKRAGKTKKAEEFNRLRRKLGQAQLGVSLSQGLASGQLQYNAKQRYKKWEEIADRLNRRANSYTTTASAMPVKWKPKKGSSVWASGFKKDSLTAADFRDDACWKGYIQQGTKKKGNRTVPNCVPVGKAKKKVKAATDGEENKMTKAKRKVWAEGYS